MNQLFLDGVKQKNVVDFTATVEKIKIKEGRKILQLSNHAILNLHKFCCIGLLDEIHVAKRSGQITVEAKCLNGQATILPSFRYSTPLPGLESRLVIREAVSDDDISGYEALARYHYRAHASFGRRTILVASIEGGGRKGIAGYLEITNSFAGHNSRNKLLDSKLSDSSGIHWDKWDIEARHKYLNVIARISRCVVHPEYRGAGIGVGLCIAAQKYCQRHWHIARLRPLFLEITADMLKFVPFAERAGMKFIGSTSGNIHRVKKDQAYLNKVHSDIEDGIRDKESHSVFSSKAKSILSKQRGDVEKIQQIARSQKISVNQMLSLYLSSSTPEGMSPQAYDLLSSLLRFPKPTYMAGLTKDASAFLSARLAKAPPTPIDEMSSAVAPISLQRSILIQNLSINYEYLIPTTPWASAIREAFGIEKTVATNTGVTNLSFEIQPKTIQYVWGPSGSGKTGLLETLGGLRQPSTGTIGGLNFKEVARFSLDFEERPLVEILEVEELKVALFCLNMSGLSEAALYFKTPNMLSAGQKHRLGIACLIASRKPVWILDEFCSVLDDRTASIVSRNVGRVVKQLGVTAIIAGPRQSPVVEALQPDQILLLNSLGSWQVKTPTKNSDLPI